MPFYSILTKLAEKEIKYITRFQANYWTLFNEKKKKKSLHLKG